MNKQYRMTPAEVAARLGLSERTLQRWRKEKTGPKWSRYGARFYYIAKDVEAWEQAKQAAMQGHLSIAQTAQLLELSENTLAAWRSTGRGPEYTRINGRVAYNEATTREWAKTEGYTL